MPQTAIGADHQTVPRHQHEAVEAQRPGLVGDEVPQRDQARRIQRVGVALRALEVEERLVDEGVVLAERR